jgi:hypothetical protein
MELLPTRGRVSMLCISLRAERSNLQSFSWKQESGKDVWPYASSPAACGAQTRRNAVLDLWAHGRAPLPVQLGSCAGKQTCRYASAPPQLFRSFRKGGPGENPFAKGFPPGYSLSENHSSSNNGATAIIHCSITLQIIHATDLIISPVERSILHGFSHMSGLYIFSLFQVRNGPGDFEDAVIRPGR